MSSILSKNEQKQVDLRYRWSNFLDHFLEEFRIATDKLTDLKRFNEILDENLTKRKLHVLLVSCHISNALQGKEKKYKVTHIVL